MTEKSFILNIGVVLHIVVVLYKQNSYFCKKLQTLFSLFLKIDKVYISFTKGSEATNLNQFLLDLYSEISLENNLEKKL